jgi:hypothetical protein
MKNLDISEYPVSVEGREVKYRFRDSIVNLMFNPELRLTGLELLKQDILARKVMDSTGDALLLEDAEYARIKQAIEAFRGFGRNDVELVRRVLECPEVKVAVAPE